MRRVEQELGAVEILVNNAGITHDAPLHKMAVKQWQDVIATDLGSCFNTCRIMIEGMRKRGFGRIVNISSINGQKGQFAQTNYAAAKAGMIGFSKALALETTSKGITVNVVAPGYTATGMVAAVPTKVLEGIMPLAATRAREGLFRPFAAPTATRKNYNANLHHVDSSERRRRAVTQRAWAPWTRGDEAGSYRVRRCAMDSELCRSRPMRLSGHIRCERQRGGHQGFGSRPDIRARPYRNLDRDGSGSFQRNRSVVAEFVSA